MRTVLTSELAQREAELREILRQSSDAAKALGVSKKAIRTVRIAIELGHEGWPGDDGDAPLTAQARFEPCTEMRCAALARYCLEHFAERDSLLWRYRRKELKRLQGLAGLADAHADAYDEHAGALTDAYDALEALAPEVAAARRSTEVRIDARHAENRSMRDQIIAWDREHGRSESAEKATDRAAQLVPVKRRTIRDWILAGRREDGFSRG
ncbi:MAG TPA: hypothetical protein VHZ95_11490 [Polyangiales bacterium]|nr:hypothetical protein [Polyangiales bacterium]